MKQQWGPLSSGECHNLANNDVVIPGFVHGPQPTAEGRGGVIEQRNTLAVAVKR